MHWTNGHRLMTAEDVSGRWIVKEHEYRAGIWKETGKEWIFEDVIAAKSFIMKELF